GGSHGFANIFPARGLVNGAFFAGPALSVYVDDIPFGDPFTYNEPLGPLDSAQVILGPQFTTFGRYPYGGVINVVTRRPTDTLEGGVYGEGGNHGLVNSGGYLMGALIPGQLRFRVGVSEEDFGGVVYNQATRRFDDTLYRAGGNFALFYTPDARWDIAFESTVHKYEDGAPRQNLLSTPDRYTYDVGFAGKTNLMTDMEALRVGYKLPGIQILSVTARRNFNIAPADVDLDLMNPTLSWARVVQDETILSQEFRVKNDDDKSAVDWSAGLYGHDKDSTQHGVHTFPGGEDDSFFSWHERWFGIFADLDYRAWKPWHFRLGARWDYVSELMNRSDVVMFPPFPNTVVTQYFKNRFPGPSVKAGVDYEVTSTVLAYVTAGLAYKPGGFSAYENFTPIAPYKDEKNKYVEVGEKATLFDGKLKANASGFIYEIHNYQLERTSSDGIDYNVINANSAKSIGAEGELRYEILPHTEVFGSGGITRVTLGTYSDPADPTAGFAGATHSPGVVAPYVPRYNGVVGASTQYLGFFAHAEWVATGTVHYSDLPGAFAGSDHQSNYAILNGGIGYGGERWKVTLFGNNLNNRFYWTNMVGFYGTGTPALPRELGLRLDVTF
ncbi:MAG TPA: TonB-dependent receptor, partial [Planctomycetota bacterium]|nr:TonB-dependent receptor [Planctomycetota bacterium]